MVNPVPLVMVKSLLGYLAVCSNMPHCHNMEVLLTSRATGWTYCTQCTGHPHSRQKTFQVLPIRNAELSNCFASLLLPGDSALEDEGLEE